METIRPSRRHGLALLAMAALFFFLSTSAQGQRQVEGGRVIHKTLPDAVRAGDLERVKVMVGMGHDVNQIVRFLNLDPPLTLAIKGGHLEVLAFLIEKGADVDLPGFNGGVTPLHAAAWQGRIEACRRLIDAGADFRRKTTPGWTPLHYAARHSRLEIISLFLELGCDIDARTTKGITPLHLALELSTPKVALQLIDSGADVLILDDKMVSTFEKACRMSSLRMVKTILSRVPPERTNYRQEILDKGLYNAFVQDFADLERFLIEQGANFNIRVIERYTLLQFSAEYGLEDSVALLLENGVDVNSRTDVARWTPLHFACLNAHLGVVRMLCEHGADVAALDGMNRTPLHLAAMSGDVSVVSELLRHGADTNLQDWDGNTPLHHAVIVGKGSVLQRLVRAASTDLDLRNSQGRTATQTATDIGRPRLANFLMRESAKKIPDSVSEGLDDAVNALLAEFPEGEGVREARRAAVARYLMAGEQPLHIAAREGAVDAAQKILAADARGLSAGDRYGYLPIHLAADTGHAGLVATFAEHGAPVGDQGNSAKWSPLHFAASRGHVDVVEALLGAGADRDARDGNGRTALDAAFFNGNNEVVALLRDSAAPR